MARRAVHPEISAGFQRGLHAFLRNLDAPTSKVLAATVGAVVEPFVGPALAALADRAGMGDAVLELAPAKPRRGARWEWVVWDAGGAPLSTGRVTSEAAAVAAGKAALRAHATADALDVRPVSGGGSPRRWTRKAPPGAPVKASGVGVSVTVDGKPVEAVLIDRKGRP